MPPRCHQSKKEAIFQLCNFLCCESISQITDLANGEILYKTIETRFPPFPEVEVLCNKDDVFENNTDSNNDNVRNKNPENESNPATKDIFLRHIKKFIDDHYQIKSETIIDFEKCINFDELEIAKIAVFVLSEIIKHLHEINSEDLITLYHLDVKFQVELESIFKLFITQRHTLNKNDVEKLLSKTAKVSPFATPRRTSTRRREELSPSTSKEDVFTNSPLKTYFESPIFKKEGVWMKEKVKYYEETLAEGDEQVSNLECKITKLENVLKNKEKCLKAAQMKTEEKDEENQSLYRDNETLKARVQSLQEELTKRTRDYDLVKTRMEELESQIDQMQMEEPKSAKRRKSSPQLLENSLLKAKDEEITLLKQKVNDLDIKNHLYKLQLKNEILAEIEIKKEKSSDAHNSSYEEEWFKANFDRIEKEQRISGIILMDNRELSEKLKFIEEENKDLHKEVESLKRKLIKKNRKSGTTEVKVTSETPETDIFRTSSIDTSCILNNSDDLIPYEHSIIASEPESLPYQKPSEAALWKMYDSQNCETESTFDINLNHDSVMSDNLLNQENDSYLLGNLNFDTFLNQLKKLTKNGSFEKVLQIFGKHQKEINRANGCNRLDLQEMLKMITECLAVPLNAESSHKDLIDKCCSTDEREFCTVIQLNNELDKFKNELSIISQRHKTDIKAYKNELEELKQEKNRLVKECQTSAEVIAEKKRKFQELYEKYSEVFFKYDNLNRKYMQLKKAYEKVLDENKQHEVELNAIKKGSLAILKKKKYYEKLYKLLQEENTKVRANLQKMKEEKAKLLKEKEAWSIESAAYRDSLPSRDSCIGLPNHLTIRPESTTFQETSNESVLSGAFHKNISYYVTENEDDFCYYNSLNPIKKEYDNERVEEIKRRNSLYPRQLQSSYPLEHLNTTYHSLYVQDKRREHHPQSKKIKLNEETEESSLFQTPISKPKKKMETPTSFQRFMKRVKCKKTLTKPKGSS